MLSKLNPFESSSGSLKIGLPGYYLPLVAACFVAAYIVSKMGLAGGIILIALPFIIIYLTLLFKNPIIGLYSSIGLAFIMLGIGRYISIPQVGLLMDSILILTFIALFFNRFHDRIDWKPARKDITLLAIIWFSYSLFELVNPEVKSTEAWFSGRGVAFYMLLIVPLTLIFIDTDHKLNMFFYIWGIFSLLASMKGIMQHFWGADRWEQGWLDEGNAATHVLFGKLRSFSFLSDAGQFGANQAYSAVVATIFSQVVTGWRKKLFFIAVAVLGFYGMVLSGTRGAISVPLSGFMAYFVMRKNLRVMIVGCILLAVVFIFFKYTSIGQGNDQVRRMRTAFDPNDASLQVRLENQRRLKIYLASRPFGGGIGHGGVKAQRFAPYAFLSNVATDSWYVLIWVEQGIVGLLLHLFILFYVMARATFQIMFRIRDPILKMKMTALASGMFGVMVASYGNAVLGGLPTGVLIYISMAVMLNTEVLDSKVSPGISPVESPGIYNTKNKMQ